MDFITLTEPGIGLILVRHTEILLIEPTAYCFSRIGLITGITKIVEESPICVINKIKLAQEIEATMTELESLVHGQEQTVSRSR